MVLPKLDKFDHAILDLLQQDARTTNVEIADRVGLSQRLAFGESV